MAVADAHVPAYELDDLVERVELSIGELEAADAVVLLTDHDDVDYELVCANASYVLDTRRCLPSSPVVELL